MRAKPSEHVVEPTSAPVAHPVSDEGVRYKQLPEPGHIVNVADATADPYNATRRELHIHGRLYAHVSEDAMGRWIYRLDN